VETKASQMMRAEAEIEWIDQHLPLEISRKRGTIEHAIVNKSSSTTSHLQRANLVHATNRRSLHAFQKRIGIQTKTTKKKKKKKEQNANWKLETVKNARQFNECSLLPPTTTSGPSATAPRRATLRSCSRCREYCVLG
jgi:hypothetical protein